MITIILLWMSNRLGFDDIYCIIGVYLDILMMLASLIVADMVLN